jgi:hypothetical protein
MTRKIRCSGSPLGRSVRLFACEAVSRCCHSLCGIHATQRIRKGEQVFLNYGEVSNLKV